ncbi:MAG TPA: IS4 family transposase [Planctomycetaceae bacterium]|nr:IS4 family transposase [Planctomycetaceae bacterium]
MSAHEAAVRLRESMDWLVDEEMFADLRVHGNSGWSLRGLTVTALLWAVSGEAGLVERFHQALVVVTAWFPRGLGALTYQGFVKALVRWTETLRPRLLARWRQRLRALGEQRRHRSGWQLFAVDGTRVAVPRTRANETACRAAPAARRRHRPRRPSRRRPTQPQLWLTVLWEVSLGLVWDWRSGPTGSNEREHLLAMLEDLPAEALVIADAGFQGYRYWRTLHDRGFSFLIRVGQNVRLLSRLGTARTIGQHVALWPDRERRRGEPPVLLRLFALRGPRSTVYVVTNVLEPDRLTPAMAAEFYRRRWGVEVFFRNFKQTFGRRQLHSHAPQNLACELDWSLLGWTALELLAARAAVARGRDPARLSPVAALTTLRDAIRRQAAHSPRRWLSLDKDDGYPRRRKAIRAWPRQKLHQPAGRPQLVPLNPEQRRTLNALQSPVS